VRGGRSSVRARLRGLARRLVIRARRALERLAGAFGFDLVKRQYYSPIPDVKALPEDIWERRSALGGVSFDAGRQLRFLEVELAPFLSEFAPPRHSTGVPGSFYIENGSYESVDAELLYAMVRHARPARVIEVGSGFSSLAIGAALAANRNDGAETNYEIIDPHPASGSSQMGGREALERLATLREESITDVSLDAFAALGDGDILFVDSTHTVKVGGDVNRIVLDVLPTLAPGVLVHFHDVFLPFEYPREWFTDEGYYWAEQYLLQAFLEFNETFEVVVAAQLLAVDHADRLTELIPSAGPGMYPGALWLRRVR